MTAFDLEQLYFLRGEIRMHDKQLKGLEREYEAAHWPEKVQEVREIIEGQRRRCVAQLESLERWLAAVPDDFMREVLTLHYSDDLTWKDAAIKMGGGNKSGTLRIAASRYLRRESA
jgi:DNA-directed RNA polymerase specialized sigma24 family protein